jgi:hypothetical protein
VKIGTKKQRGHNFYPSPIEAVYGLLAAEGEHLPRGLWEPACGDGALVMPLRLTGRQVVATDLVDRHCPQSLAGVDFLLERQAPAGVAGIVTNPPYGRGLTLAFVEHALGLAPYVAMLLPIAFVGSGRRYAFFRRSPPSAMHFFSERLPMMHREGWDGPTATSQVDYAWFVWDARRPGAGRVSWIGPPELAAGRAELQAHYERLLAQRAP